MQWYCNSTSHYNLAITHPHISQAFNLPPQLYYLGPDCTQPLERTCRQHFNLHAEWVHAAELEREATIVAEQYKGRAAKIQERLASVSVELDSAINSAMIRFNTLRQQKVGAQSDPSAEPIPRSHQPDASSLVVNRLVGPLC